MARLGAIGQIVVGQWPWSMDNTSGSGLPRRLDDNKVTKTLWAFNKNISQGTEWNMFWEIWTHSSSPISSNNITLDLMIHPSYGQKSGNYYGKVTLSQTEWEVWEHQHPGGFRLIHFYRAIQSDSPGQLNIDDFLNFCVQQKWLANTDWLGSVTAGQEAYSGAGTFSTYQWKVWTENKNSSNLSPPPQSQDVIFVDDCNYFDLIYSKTSGWRIEQWTPIDNDLGKFQRTDFSPQEIVYYKSRLSKIDILLYWSIGYQALKTYVSTNGSQWKEIVLKKGQETPLGDGYRKAMFSANQLPTNSNYLKLQLQEDSHWWQPMIGKVALTHAP